MSKFAELIEKFNAMYKLSNNAAPSLEVGEEVRFRIANFQATLLKELEEVMDIRKFLHDRNVFDYLNEWKINLSDVMHMPQEELEKITTLVMIADWLGDIQVYCASEMKKYGLDNDAVLSTIMDSNFSKLDANGLPIYDEKGKVLKGPNYYKPEKELFKLIAWARLMSAKLT